MTSTRNVETTQINGRVLEGGAFLGNEEAIRPDVPNRQAIAREKFTLEWGVRETDGALVIHIFPHIVGDDISKEWDMSYKMDKRLEHAIPSIFNTASVNAGFESAYNSFYVIVKAVISADLRLLVQKFVSLVEDAPLSH